MAKTAYITCRPRPDGAGALAHSQVSVILYARLKGLKYLHQPMKTVGHNTHQVTDWDHRWETFFSFGLDEDLLDEQPRNTITLDDGSKIDPQPDTLYDVLHCHDFTYQNPARYNAVRDALRERFFRANHLVPPSTHLPSSLKIVVHVRRGDISPQMTERYTSTEKVCSLIDWVLEVTTGLDFENELHVCSEGDIRDFDSLVKRGAYVHLDDPFDAFKRMVQADILIGAKSSFSWLAAFLSAKIAIFEPSYLMLLPDWLVTDPSGVLPQDRLTACLIKLRNSHDT